MGNDVVNDCCCYKPSVCFALHAQWILSEIRLAYPLPLTAVATLGGGRSVGVEELVQVTIAVICKVRTAGMAARSFGFTGHDPPPCGHKKSQHINCTGFRFTLLLYILAHLITAIK